MGETVPGPGVLDKAMVVLGVLEDGPHTLAELTQRTGFPRASAHRLAVMLEGHGLLRRTGDGRFALGLRLIGLGRAAAESFDLRAQARPVLEQLRDDTGESVQLFVRQGDRRICVLAFESLRELRTAVPEGASLPLHLGSGGRVLSGDAALKGEGWVESVAEREPGVASVSAPVRDGLGEVIAAISVSGPLERLGRQPGRRFGAAVAAAASRVSLSR